MAFWRDHGCLACRLQGFDHPFIRVECLVREQYLCLHVRQERIRSNQKILKIPVIMMTGKSEVTDVARGLSLGADGYVTKPFKISGLVSAVNTVLGIE